jgi:8-amino-7-oxononanoate synthase
MEYGVNEFLRDKLLKREEQHILRTLTRSETNQKDFYSNDYLGFASNKNIYQKASYYLQEDFKYKLNGSSGSRLISGNNPFIEDLEDNISKIHLAEKALLFNSGYDANLGFWSCVPQRNDTILYDELIHASIRDGIKLSNSKTFAFNHNSADDLDFKAGLVQGNVFVAVESIYSMDGDFLNSDIVKVCKQNSWNLIVDEAHACGITGPNNLGMFNYLNWQHDCFARIITYGKAFGTHGASIIGSKLLIEYLINFSRPFIYTTAATPHQFASIKASYDYLLKNNSEQSSLNLNIESFNAFANQLGLSKYFIELNDSPIKAILPGNKSLTIELSKEIKAQGFLIKPIFSPTVSEGRERIRICIHSFNTEEEIIGLLITINQFMTKNI